MAVYELAVNGRKTGVKVNKADSFAGKVAGPDGKAERRPRAATNPLRKHPHFFHENFDRRCFYRRGRMRGKAYASFEAVEGSDAGARGIKRSGARAGRDIETGPARERCFNAYPAKSIDQTAFNDRSAGRAFLFLRYGSGRA